MQKITCGVLYNLKAGVRLRGSKKLGGAEVIGKQGASKGHFPEGLNPPDLFREYFFRKYDRLPGYTRFETNLIITYFSVSLGVIYRQWEVDGQQIPLEKMVPLATRLILHGLDGAGLTAGTTE